MEKKKIYCGWGRREITPPKPCLLYTSAAFCVRGRYYYRRHRGLCYVNDKHAYGSGVPRGKERTRYMRVKVTLACSECKQRNYDTAKNKKNDPDRIEISKYCRFCRKHTVHKETK